MEINNKINLFFKVLFLVSLLAAPPAQAINTQTHMHTCIHTHNGVVHRCGKKSSKPAANVIPAGDPVSSAIVDIDAAHNGVDNPVQIYLAAGVYTVQPIGTAQGGKFDAWNPWGIWRNRVTNCKSDGSGCKKGWIEQYHVAGPFGTYGKNNGRWRTPDLALSNGLQSSFTLEKPAMVSFFVKDQHTRNGRTVKYYFDNVGGTSLMITGGDIPVPSVDLAADQVSSEGNTLTVTATLSGPAANYPVVVPFTVGAQSTAQEGIDYSLSAHEIVINAGTMGSSTVTLLKDNVFEGDETLTLEMGDPQNAVKGAQVVSSIQISDYNLAPSVALAVDQGENTTRRVFVDRGRVTVTADVIDPNPGDHHHFDWSLSDNRLIRLAGPGASDDAFSFDAGLLQPGFYKLHVTVSDDGLPSLSGSSELLIEITQPAADHAKRQDDNDEGLAGDDEENDQGPAFRDVDLDGIIDRFDDENLKDNELQEIADTACDNHGKKACRDGKDKDSAAHFIMRTKPGLKLALGDIAFKAGAKAAQIGEKDIVEHGGSRRYSSDKYLHAGGYYDFQVSRLAGPGRSVDVVIPLTEAIPAHAAYRKYVARLGWQNFVQNGGNTLKSAKGAPGSCPAPGDTAYRPGLIPGSRCLHLTVQDGGPNDNDALANGIIGNTGDIATAPRVAKRAKSNHHHRRHKRHRSHNHNRNHNHNVHQNSRNTKVAAKKVSRKHHRHHRRSNRNRNVNHHSR